MEKRPTAVICPDESSTSVPRSPSVSRLESAVHIENRCLGGRSRGSPRSSDRGGNLSHCLCKPQVFAISPFRMYLAGRRFKLLTHCAALTWLFKSRDLSPTLHRWALQPMEYDFLLQWRPGVLHSAPDALSRLPPENETPKATLTLRSSETRRKDRPSTWAPEDPSTKMRSWTSVSQQESATTVRVERFRSQRVS